MVGVHHEGGRYNASSGGGEILPIIADYVGYSACSLSYDPEGIARSSFGIISYITHTMPHAECTHSLCGNDDVHGTRLANAFSKGLSSRNGGTGDTDLQDAILDLILSNIKTSASPSNSPNLGLMMLGLGGSRHNCLNVILDLIADSRFVLDPKTSSSATKCFELIFRVCELGNSSTAQNSGGLSASNNAAVRAHPQQPFLMEKLRRGNFWHTQVVHYLGMRGPSTPSIFHEISNSYCIEHGDDMEIMGRDNDVLHSISWLLKGLAIELHCLMDQEQNQSTMSGMMLPTGKSNNQFLTLINCLVFQPNSLLLTALIDMPLGHSTNGFIQERLHSIKAPSSDVLRNSSTSMPGPVEICAGYEMIDIAKINGGPSSSEWATAWNSLVLRTCACSHLSQAWSDLVRTALVFYPMVNNNMVEGPHEAHFHMSTRAAMDILCNILQRLLNPTHLDALGGQYFDVQHASSAGNVEAECSMPLSIAALTLTEILTESSQDDEAGFIAEEDVARVCGLIMGAISSCTESGAGTSPNDGRAAVLSCALTRMLALSEEASYSIFSQNTPTDMLDIYAKAVVFLFRLSTAPVFDTEGRYANADQAKRGAISLAARSGLSSLFGHLKSIEDHNPVSEIFCSKIFTLDTLSTAASQLVHLIACDDNDVAYLLQQIALFRDGVQLLAGAGVTTKLLDFAKAYSLEERSYLSSHLGSNDAAQLKPPSLLKGHLSLLNSLLSSPLTKPDRVALAGDSYQLLEVYCGTFDRMLRLYPTNGDLTIKFIEALYLTYSALKESTGSNVLGSSHLNVDESLMTLEGSVLRIACQLSAFPFPSHLLPPLPMELINVEKIHASQTRLSINLGNEKTWWDSIPDSALSGQPMPSPPTGSFDVVSQQRYTSYKHGASSAWSEGKYQYAVSSAKCLETSILFLISRVNFVAQRGLPTFCIDAVAISKGICRCSDGSRAIQDRLNALKSHPEEDITKMLDASNVRSETWSDQPLSQTLNLEREYLFQLGSTLGQCAEKLVCLALQDARRMAASSSSISKPENLQEWAYFIGALTPALDHTEMDKKGVGCAFSGDGAETSKALAQALRQEMEKMKTVLQ